MKFLIIRVILEGMKLIRYKQVVLIFFLILSAGVNVFAESAEGVISYLEGTVDVYRDGKILDWELVDIGFTVKEYDLIETGDDGVVELDVTMPSGTNAGITVQPNTSFYFEMGKNSGGASRTSFKMLTGSMAYKVQKLTGGDSLNVQTASAAMGVRGTEFQVVYSPEGGVLVLCSEGKVEVADRQGQQRYSKPGSVVEKVPEKEITAFAVDPSDLGMYRSYWVSARDEVFKAGADTFIKGFARQYLQYKPKFESAYSELLKVKTALEKYGSRDIHDQMGEFIRIKSKVSPAVVGMRSILPVYEMVYYRLKVLEKYHDQGLGQGVIKSGLTTKQFFNTFKKRKSVAERQLADVRYMFKLYTVIHNAAGGGPSILDSPFGGIPSGNMPKSSLPSR